jgi:hypothetical protein
MDREIWFERILWNYWPCHWKGWAITAMLFVCCTVGIALSTSSHGFSAVPFLLVLVPSWIWFMVMAVRHSS